MIYRDISFAPTHDSQANIMIYHDMSLFHQQRSTQATVATVLPSYRYSTTDKRDDARPWRQLQGAPPQDAASGESNAAAFTRAASAGGEEAV